MGARVRMSEKEAIARGLIPDPKTQFTTPSPADPGVVFDREQYNREQVIPKLVSTPKPEPRPGPAPAIAAARQPTGAFVLLLSAILGWIVGFVCGLRMGGG